MKKTLLLSLFAILTFALSAQEISSMNVGYCDGEYKASSTQGFSTSTKDTYVSGAILLPAATMRLYRGNYIESIHAALASALNIDELTVWVRTELDGDNMAEGTITKTTDPKLAKGWNDVALSNPYYISDDCPDLYVGYTFHQAGSAVGMSVLTNTMLETTEGGCFVKLGTDAEWEDRHTDATLCVEAMIAGDNLPKYNLKLRSLSTQPTFVLDKGTLEVNIEVQNLATVTISRFDAICDIEGGISVAATLEEPIAYKEVKYYTFIVMPEGIDDSLEYRNMTVTLGNFAEGTDEETSDNSLSTTFDVVNHDFTRRVLIEEFTTEQCPNCPRVANYFHEYLSEPENSAKVTALCHHSGYYTDWLTIPSDNDYMWFYNEGGSTYAPAVMFDRVIDESWSRSETTPMTIPGSANEFGRIVDLRRKDSAFVSLAIKADINEEGNAIAVKVNGERSKEDFTVNPARIVVVLSEDNIQAHSQQGASDTFYHQHVSRAVNSVWGKEIEWNGDSYEYECELPVKSGYERENLVVVAYIWDYDPSNVANCKIANSEELRADMFNKESGIQNVLINTAGVEYYSIDGKRLSQPQKGLNIVRLPDGSTKKIMVND